MFSNKNGNFQMATRIAPDFENSHFYMRQSRVGQSRLLEIFICLPK